MQCWGGHFLRLNFYEPLITNSNKLWLDSSNKGVMFIQHNTLDSAIGTVSLCEFNVDYAVLFVINPWISYTWIN